MRNLFSILLVGLFMFNLFMFTVLLLTGCSDLNSNTISNETIKISNFQDIHFQPIKETPVNELDIDEAINMQFVNDYDEGDNPSASLNEKFDDNWVLSQNIPDVKNTDDYRNYLKEQIKIEHNGMYNQELDETVWNELKTHCIWINKPDKEIEEIYNKNIKELEDDEIDDEVKSICLKEAEEEAKHKEAVSLLAKKYGIHVIQTDIDIKKEELMKEMDCTENELYTKYSGEELEYEALKDWVNHFVYNQLKNNTQ